jgi:hypothetical protein
MRYCEHILDRFQYPSTTPAPIWGVGKQGPVLAKHEHQLTKQVEIVVPSKPLEVDTNQPAREAPRPALTVRKSRHVTQAHAQLVAGSIEPIHIVITKEVRE